MTMHVCVVKELNLLLVMLKEFTKHIYNTALSFSNF
jgi:hypothetical protein